MVIAKITDHGNKYKNEKFETLQELPTWDAETHSEQMLLEKKEKNGANKLLHEGLPQTFNL